jgi:P27 family predicted phage terminase small subunit
MARPRKPTNILHLAGAFKKNPSRLRERAQEPKLPKGIGEPPDWLDTHAVEEWARVVPDLEGAGVTSRVESTALGAYCQAVSRLRKAEAEIFRDGITIMTDSGLKKHPAVGIAERAALIMAKLASEFGMTPASRSRVTAKPTNEAKPDAEFAAV